MHRAESDIELVLIATKPERSCMIRDAMQQAGVNGLIRRLPPGGQALDCGRRTGVYKRKAIPDLMIFDFSETDEYSTEVLRELAFGESRARIPVVVLTSQRTQRLLDSGEVDGGKAIMFSPTRLQSFIGKLHQRNKGRFLKALTTLYQYGPILVEAPDDALVRESLADDKLALSA